MSSYELAELQRKLANMIQITTITEVDHARRKLRVLVGADNSAELPWPAAIGRNWKRWTPLRKGQQVVIACPDGNPAQAVLIGNLYRDGIDSPATDADLDVIEFENGARIEHDISCGVLALTGFSDVLVDGVSVPFHVHGKVKAGTDSTGKPQ